MNDSITLKVNVDKLIMQALEEDITSEDISTNAVMPAYQKGQVELICKQDGIVAGLNVFCRVFIMKNLLLCFVCSERHGCHVFHRIILATHVSRFFM